MDRGAWQAIGHGAAESDVTDQLNMHTQYKGPRRTVFMAESILCLNFHDQH